MRLEFVQIKVDTLKFSVLFVFLFFFYYLITQLVNFFNSRAICKKQKRNMESLKTKLATNKQESSMTNVLRMICKQKETVANKYKSENEKLHTLLLKQQSLLNKLNEDNMMLNRNNTGPQLAVTQSSKEEYDDHISNVNFIFLLINSIYIYIYKTDGAEQESERATAGLSNTWRQYAQRIE